MSDTFQPIDYTVSWVRAYSCLKSPSEILALRQDRAKAVDYFGPGLIEIAEGDEDFWDVQTTRRQHVARAVLGGLRVRLDPDDPHWWPVHVHLLFHVSGFMIIRLTLDRSDRPSTRPLRDWNRLAALPWGSEALEWEGAFHDDFKRAAGVREVMDVLFHDLHERSHGRTPQAGVFAQDWSYEARYAWYDGRVRADEMTSAYPVTFGTSFETVWPSANPSRDILHQAARLASPVHAGRHVDGLLDDFDDRWWYFGENTAVLVAPDDRARRGGSARLDAIDPIRTQIIEYLTLQRAALRTVQRATQLAISEGARVNRKDVARWSRLVASLSDDYVLHDQVAALLKPVRRHLTENPTLRDPEQLAEQVRANLQSFESLISSANNRAGLVMSGLFGAIAATSLDPVVHEVAYRIDGGTGGVDAYSSAHPTLMAVLDVSTLIAAALLAVACFSLFVLRVRTTR